MSPRALHAFRAIVGAGALVLAACSGSPTSSLGVGSPGASAPPSLALPSGAIPSVAIPSFAIPSFVLPSGVVPPGQAAIDVCGLFGQPELEQITGRSLIATTPNLAGGPSGCTWEFSSGQPGLNWELIVGVTRPGGKEAFDDSKPFANTTASPVPGVGDDNYPVPGNTIFALKGDTMVDVQWLDLGTNSKGFDVPPQIAKLTLERLP